MVVRRRPVSALLLSIIPGLGQVYNGQLVKGIVFLLIDLLIPVIAGLAGILNHLSGLAILLVFSVAFILYRMADGFMQARKLTNYELKPCNRWYVYVLFIAVLSSVRLFFDLSASTGIQTFKIPTTSMSPTLQPGDMVVASVDYYESNPIRQGDIVVFNSSLQGIWTFRVIGLPNDSIEVRDGKTYVNNIQNELTSAEEYVFDDQEVVQYQEQISAAKSIKTLRYKNIAPGETKEFKKTKIPDNEYFLMGDNRDNAFDSRFMGTIKRDDILGRVIYSYWGNTSDRINIDFTKK